MEIRRKFCFLSDCSGGEKYNPSCQIGVTLMGLCRKYHENMENIMETPFVFPNELDGAKASVLLAKGRSNYFLVLLYNEMVSVFRTSGRWAVGSESSELASGRQFTNIKTEVEMTSEKGGFLIIKFE